MNKIKDPWIISNFFSELEYKKIMSVVNSIDKRNWMFEHQFSRYTYSSPILDKLSALQLDRARSEFGTNTLLYTYSMLSFYNRDDSSLKKHKDDNACTYTFDICLYSEKPWPIVVEGEEYVLKNNEALCFYGEDQYHWRPKIDENNKVLMLFMHWAEPDHIFFQDWSNYEYSY